VSEELVVRNCQALSDLIGQVLQLERDDDNSWDITKFHPSSDGYQCIRKVVFRMLGTPEKGLDQDSLMTFMIGRYVHEGFQEKLTGLGLLDPEDVEVHIDDEEINLHGKADGLIIASRLIKFLDDYGVEINPDERRSYLKLEIIDYY